MKLHFNDSYLSEEETRKVFEQLGIFDTRPKKTDEDTPEETESKPRPPEPYVLDLQMEFVPADTIGEHILGMAWPFEGRIWIQNYLPPHLTAKVIEHELMHVLCPYLSEWEVRLKTGTTPMAMSYLMTMSKPPIISSGSYNMAQERVGCEACARSPLCGHC